MGIDENNIVIVRNEFQKQAGDKLTIGLSYPLSGEGIDGDNKLEDNEETLQTFDFAFYINQKRNAVRLKGKMSEKKTRLKLRREARDRLSLWLSEIIDKELTRKAAGVTTWTFANTPTAPTVGLYGGDATGDTDMASSDWLGTAEIDRMKTRAQTASPKVQPLRIAGGDFYVLQIHPNQTYLLKHDSNWKNAQMYAMPRGSSNPLFTNAIGGWNGVLIHENEELPELTINSLACRRALLLGRQALVLGFGGAISWQEETFDFGNQVAFAVGRIFGCQAAKYNSKDLGRIAMDSYAPAPTGVAHS